MAAMMISQLNSALAGRHDEALDLLEQLLSIPSMVSRGLLLFDPLYDPLRSNPCFQALLSGGGSR